MATKYIVNLDILGWRYTRVYNADLSQYVGYILLNGAHTVTSETIEADDNTLEIVNAGLNVNIPLMTNGVPIPGSILTILNNSSSNVQFSSTYLQGVSSVENMRPRFGGNEYITDVRYGVYVLTQSYYNEHMFFLGALDNESGENISIPNLSGNYNVQQNNGFSYLTGTPYPSVFAFINVGNVSSNSVALYLVFDDNYSISFSFGFSNNSWKFYSASYYIIRETYYDSLSLSTGGTVSRLDAFLGPTVTTIPVDPVEPSTGNDTRLPSQQSGGDSGSGDNSTDSGANDDDTPSQTTPEPGPDEEEPDPTPFPDPPPNIGGKGSGKVEGESIGTEALGTPDEFLGTGLNLYEFPYTYSLQNFLKILWSDTQSFKDMLANTFQNNLANCVLRIYAAKFTPEHASDTAVNIKLGSYETDVAAYKMKQYSSGSLGTFTLSEYYGSFLDYETKLEIFLPFVGFRELMPDKYISQYKTNNAFSINIWYQIDWLAGQIAYILYTGSINDNGYMNENTTPADIFTGNIAAEIPIASSQISNLLGSFVSGLGSAAGAAVSANNLLAGSGNTAAALAGVGLGLAGAATSALGFQKQTYTVQGSYGGNVGMLMPQEPYLIIYRPIQYKGYQKAHYLGYNMKLTLTAIGQLPANNFFKFDSVYLKGNIPADIKEDILQQLKQGVYI